MPQAVTPRLRQPENPKKAPIDYTRPPASVLKFTDTLFDTVPSVSGTVTAGKQFIPPAPVALALPDPVESEHAAKGRPVRRRYHHRPP
jgi:hypothetical protein